MHWRMPCIALERLPDGSVVFLDMDAPKLSCTLEYLQNGLLHTDMAMLCPADDGASAMLCMPPQQADASRVFPGVHWSHALTAVS
jgi:hypothetical protein